MRKICLYALPQFEGMYRLQEPECNDKEGPFSLARNDQLLERVFEHPFFCFLDGYSGYFYIEIVVED